MDKFLKFFKYSKENANLIQSIPTGEKEIISNYSKRMAKELLGDLYTNHENGDYHIHDLDFFWRPNCLQHPIEVILTEGMKLPGQYAVSGPPKRPLSAINLIVKALQHSQSNMAGGQSISMFNVWLAPFVRNASRSEIVQILQHFVFELNQTHTSRGYQSIFSSINCEYGIPDFMKDYPVKYRGISGEFGDYEDEAKMIVDVLCDIYLEGDYDGKPFMFPNMIMNVRKETFDPELNKKVTKVAMERNNVYWLNSIKYGRELATVMGCVDGSEVIAVRYNDETKLLSFSELWAMLTVDLNVPSDKTYVIDVDDMYILDDTGWVKLNRLIRNPPSDQWLKITFDSGKFLLVTPDHPFVLVDGTEISAEDLEEGDEIEYNPISVEFGNKILLESHIESFAKSGLIPDNILDFDINVVKELINKLLSNRKTKCKNKYMMKSVSEAKKVQMILEMLGLKSYIQVTSDRVILDVPEISRFAETEVLTVKSIEVIDYEGFSYDVETESGFFVVSCVKSHNCRTYLDDLSGDWKRFSVGTGNFNYVTINLPRLAYIQGNINLVKNRFRYLVKRAIEAMLIRRKLIYKLLDSPEYKAFKFFDLNNREDYGKRYWNIEYSTMGIGFVGLHEFKEILGLSDNEALDFVRYMDSFVSQLNSKKYQDFYEDYDIDTDEVTRFSLIASPAESAATRLRNKDEEIYGLSSYKDYYTNSFHIPEEGNVTWLEKVMEESKYHIFCGGGAITHLWMSEKDYDPTAMTDIIYGICENSDIRYFTFSPIMVYCKSCKTIYNSPTSTVDLCRKCKSKDIKLYSKITGYISEVNNWNYGKRKELDNRNLM